MHDRPLPVAAPSRGVSAGPMLLLGVGAAAALYLFFYLPRQGFDYNLGYWLGRDFLNFWAGGTLTVGGAATDVTDLARYNAWIVATFGEVASGFFIFSYPPTILALLLPLGLMSYGMALAVWTSANLAAVAAAMRTSPESTGLTLLLAVLSPAVLVNGFQGLLCGFTAALLFAALMLLDRRPVVAGVLLGLLTLKPHLGIVAGLVVLMERRWTTVAATAVTAVALGGLSIGVAGTAVWAGYLDRIVPAQKDFIDSVDAGFRFFLVTPYALFKQIGLPSPVALSLHGAIAVSFAGVALWLWRHVGDRLVAILIVAIATLIATPYANLYDLTLVALPLAALIARDGAATAGPRTAILALWLLPAAGLPLALTVGPMAPILLVGAGGAVILAAAGRADFGGRAVPDAARA